MLWINQEKQRYYKLVVSRVLCLIRAWGSLVNHQGGSKQEIVANDAELTSCVKTITRKRQQRNYQLVDASL